MFPPMHHPGGATADDANLMQRFVDSEGGSILGTFLHTFGALLFTAGIALYIYQAHLVRSARASQTAPSLHLLPYAHGFNLGGIILNGLGGTMRLYQSDHPRIDQLTASTWVQLLFAKHIFLIVGAGLAIFLTYRTHILSLRDDAASVFLGETRRMTGFAWGSFLTILLASVLGAMATTQLAPMEDGMDDGGMGPNLQTPGGGVTSFAYHNDTGVITGSAVAPGRETTEIPVPQLASQMWIELTWSNTQASTLDLQVRDPNGKPVQGKKTSTAGRVVYELTSSLVAGSWRADVLSTQAVNERYNLFSRVTIGSPLEGDVLEETYTVNPKTVGTSARFVEINLNMKQGQTIQYTWDVIDSEEKLDFNVHLHVGNQVDYPVRGSWNRYDGTYTHNTTTTDGVSLMWENPQTTPLRLHLRITGEFQVHSKVAR